MPTEQTEALTTRMFTLNILILWMNNTHNHHLSQLWLFWSSLSDVEQSRRRNLLLAHWSPETFNPILTHQIRCLTLKYTHWQITADYRACSPREGCKNDLFSYLVCHKLTENTSISSEQTFDSSVASPCQKFWQTSWSLQKTGASFCQWCSDRNLWLLCSIQLQKPIKKYK